MTRAALLALLGHGLGPSWLPPMPQPIRRCGSLTVYGHVRFYLNGARLQESAAVATGGDLDRIGAIFGVGRWDLN